jgi:hypothetical protein
MAAAEQQRVVVQDYPAEMAGKLVGWVHVRRNEYDIDESNFVFASVCYARVSNEGANLSYITSPEGEVLTGRHTNRGFQEPTELTVVASGSGVMDLTPMSAPGLPSSLRQERKSESIGTRLYTDDNILQGMGSWALGGAQIIEILKENLAAKDASHIYENLYYSLNIMAPEYQLLADASMQERTQELRSLANDYRNKLGSVLEYDKAMVKNLTIFGDISPEQIPSAFRDFRVTVANTERQLSEAREALPFGRWYMPIGSRPSGRTWPYMDPLASEDKDGVLQHVQSALEQENVEPANSELAREITELMLRGESALNIAQRLGKLASKEAEVADA